MLQPVASKGTSRSVTNTNLSRTVALSVLDANGNELAISADRDHPIELTIPRDANVAIPPMALQNVTSIDGSPHRQSFSMHFSNITTTLPISVHFEMRPLNASLAYLFVYRFDSGPQVNSSVQLIDGWTSFCPSSLSKTGLHSYFIDNQQTLNHQSLIVGLRELSAAEITDACSNASVKKLPITDQRANFSANYELRVYTSGCYYLDANNAWQADGLVVGSLTDYHQTRCTSTHLTSFAGGFIVLPAPVNWSYVFANADFAKNKTIYITLMVVCILYIVLLIFARAKDKKDVQKVRGMSTVDTRRVSTRLL